MTIASLQAGFTNVVQTAAFVPALVASAHGITYASQGALRAVSALSQYVPTNPVGNGLRWAAAYVPSSLTTPFVSLNAQQRVDRTVPDTSDGATAGATKVVSGKQYTISNTELLKRVAVCVVLAFGAFELAKTLGANTTFINKALTYVAPVNVSMSHPFITALRARVGI